MDGGRRKFVMEFVAKFMERKGRDLEFLACLMGRGFRNHVLELFARASEWFPRARRPQFLVSELGRGRRDGRFEFLACLVERGQGSFLLELLS